jgi:hypothetical protein
VEVSPAKASPNDLFLNVMQIMDGDAAPLPVQSVDSATTAGVRIADRVVLFQRDSRRADREIKFAISGPGSWKFLATDLAAGTWQVSRDGAALAPNVTVTADEGTAWFSGPAGNYVLQHR